MATLIVSKIFKHISFGLDPLPIILIFYYYYFGPFYIYKKRLLFFDKFIYLFNEILLVVIIYNSQITFFFLHFYYKILRCYYQRLLAVTESIYWKQKEMVFIPFPSNHLAKNDNLSLDGCVKCVGHQHLLTRLVV